MIIEVLDAHDAAAARAADLVAAAVDAGARVLALPTGRTMMAVYDALVQRPIDWQRLTTFNLDEFATLAPSHPGSFRAYMEAQLFGRVPLPASAIEFLRGDAADLEAECSRYEAAIDAAGGLDLALLGLGTNGHVAFNEPAEVLHAGIHVETLLEATRRANAGDFAGEWRAVPAQALTIGMRHLLQARRLVVVATGPSKAEVVAAAFAGPLTTRCPASWLQTHRDVTLVLDAAAARGLGSTGRNG